MIATDRATAINAIAALLPTVESAMLAHCHTVCVQLEPLNDLINATIALYGIGAPRDHAAPQQLQAPPKEAADV